MRDDGFYPSPISLIILLSPISAIFRWELVDIHLDIESTVVTTSDPIIFSSPDYILHLNITSSDTWTGRGQQIRHCSDSIPSLQSISPDCEVTACPQLTGIPANPLTSSNIDDNKNCPKFKLRTSNSNTKRNFLFKLNTLSQILMFTTVFRSQSFSRQ